MKKQLRTRELRLSKQTVQHLGIPLKLDDQKTIKGGSDTGTVGITDIPIFCRP